MLGAAAGDYRGDALGPDLAAVLVVVIAAVGVDPVGPLARAAAAAADWRDRRNQRHQLGDVVTLPAGQRHRQRVPCASVIRWCFEPGLARSTGLGPVWAALQRAHMRAVNHRLGPVQRPGRMNRPASMNHACSAGAGDDSHLMGPAHVGEHLAAAVLSRVPGLLHWAAGRLP
jgi:hypothetical protein